MSYGNELIHENMNWIILLLVTFVITIFFVENDENI